jgi:hypothetical protein
VSDQSSSGPKTFEELNASALALPPCQRCGKPAEFEVRLTARRPTGRQGIPKPEASHKGRLCEPCAVAIFAKFREVIR